MLESVVNYKLKDFAVKNIDRASYEQLLSFLKPKNSYKNYHARDVLTMKFYEVENLKRWLSEPTIANVSEAVSCVFGISKEKLLNVKIIDFFHIYNFIVKEIKKIISFEENLSKKPEQELLAAGVERLNQFGVLNTLDALALRYGLHPKEVEQWEYSYCFSLLFKMKVEEDIRESYNEILKYK